MRRASSVATMDEAITKFEHSLRPLVAQLRDDMKASLWWEVWQQVHRTQSDEQSQLNMQRAARLRDMEDELREREQQLNQRARELDQLEKSLQQRKQQCQSKLE